MYKGIICPNGLQVGHSRNRRPGALSKFRPFCNNYLQGRVDSFLIIKLMQGRKKTASSRPCCNVANELSGHSVSLSKTSHDVDGGESGEAEAVEAGQARRDATRCRHASLPSAATTIRTMSTQASIDKKKIVDIAFLDEIIVGLHRLKENDGFSRSLDGEFWFSPSSCVVSSHLLYFPN